MAIRIDNGSRQSKTVIKVGNTTQVKEIRVGSPVRIIDGSSGELNNLTDVNSQSLIDGSVLVFNDSTKKWVSQLTLDKQNITGGQY